MMTEPLSKLRAWTVPGVTAVFVAVLVFLSLHGVAAIKSVAVFLGLHHRPVSLGALLRALSVWDALAALLALGLAVWLIWLERRRMLSAFLAQAPGGAYAVAGSIVLAFLAHCYFYPGILLGGDTGSHISRFLEVARGLEQGELPQWTNYQYLGSPLLGFTGPLIYVVGGALDVVLHDAVLTAKILLFVLDIACGWISFALLRRFGLSRFGASVGALAYTGSFAHLHLFLYRGVFPQAFTICFFLAVFLAAEGIMRAAPDRPRRRWLDWASFAFATGGLIVTHQPHAVFVALYLGVFGLASLAVGRWRLAGAVDLVSAGLVGLVMSTIAVVPILAESSWVMIDPDGGLVGFRVPTLTRLLHLVIWRNTRTTWGTDYWAYVGIVLLVLCVVGLVHTLRHPLRSAQTRLVTAAVPCLVLSFFLANPVVRDIMFLLLFLTIPGAVGAERIVAYLGTCPRAPLAVLGLLLLDLTSTSIQPVARTDKGFLIAEGPYLARTAADRRVVEAFAGQHGAVSLGIGPNGTPMSYDATVQRVAGNHNMAATLVHNYAVTIVKMGEQDLKRDGRLAPETAKLLALLNVGRIICNDSIAVGCPARLAGLQDEGPLGRVVPIAQPTPVLFSQRLIQMRPPQGLDKPMLWAEQFAPPVPQVTRIEGFLHAYLAAARPDLATDIAAAIPVQAVVPQAAPAGGATGDDAGEWRPHLSDYRVGLQHVTVTVQSDRAGYVQLTHPWFPSNLVLVNHQPVTTMVGAWHLLVVPIQAGVSTIEVVPTTTPIRVLSGWISLFGVIIGLTVPLIGAWRQKRRRA
jgi:hypothetical protein